MNKISHINVTSRLATNLTKVGKFWLLLGSIGPDLLVHTYYVGHRWNETFEKTCKKLYNLEQWGNLNWLSCLKLGYALHYIEDYFTYPHNDVFEGTLPEHYKYEIEFSSYISDKKSKVESYIEFSSAKDLCDWLEATHKEYLSDVHGFSTDYKYMTAVSQAVVDCMLNAFEANECRRLDRVVDIPIPAASTNM